MLGPGSSVVVVLELGGWDVAELAVESAVVEPVDPGEGLQLDVLRVAPGAPPADELGLVEAVHRLGERVVVALSGQCRAGRVWLGSSVGLSALESAESFFVPADVLGDCFERGAQVGEFGSEIGDAGRVVVAVVVDEGA